MEVATRMKIAGLVGLVGASVALAMVLQDGGRVRQDDLPFIGAALVGACGGGAAFARLFGWQGRIGWLAAATGAVLATGLGGGIGGGLFALILMPPSTIEGFMIGPVYVVMALLSDWKVTAVWGLGFAVTQRLVLRAHAPVDAHAKASGRA
jgi:hypothetical protein